MKRREHRKLIGTIQRLACCIVMLAGSAGAFAVTIVEIFNDPYSSRCDSVVLVDGAAPVRCSPIVIPVEQKPKADTPGPDYYQDRAFSPIMADEFAVTVAHQTAITTETQFVTPCYECQCPLFNVEVFLEDRLLRSTSAVDDRGVIIGTQDGPYPALAANLLQPFVETFSCSGSDTCYDLKRGNIANKWRERVAISRIETDQTDLTDGFYLDGRLSASISLDETQTFKSGNPVQQGQVLDVNLWLDGVRTVRIVYESRPWQDYAFDILDEQDSGVGNLNALLNRGWARAIGLREFGPQTSSQNTGLRDAEYCLRGMQGGWELSAGATLSVDMAQFVIANGGVEGFFSALFNETGNRGGPLALAAYTAIKSLKKTFGGDIAGPSEFPSSSIGGFGPNYRCWLEGFTAAESLRAGRIDNELEALERLIRRSLIDTTSAARTDANAVLQARSPVTAPILADNVPFEFISADIPWRGDIFGFSEHLGSDSFVLRKPADQFQTFSANDGLFSSVALGVDSGSVIGNPMLLFSDGEQQFRIPLNPGEVVLFADYTSLPVADFVIQGTPTGSAALEVNMGVVSGASTVFVWAATAELPIDPAPSNIVLMIQALCAGDSPPEFCSR